MSNPESLEFELKKWCYHHCKDIDEALSIINEPPIKGPGEMSITMREDGTVGLFYLAKGPISPISISK